MANDDDSSIEMDVDYPDAAEVDDSSDEEEESDDEEEDSGDQARMVTPPRPTAPATPEQASTPSEAAFTAIEERPTKKPRRQFSIANDDITAKNIVLVHVDLETGGPYCGVIQLAVVMYDHASRQKIGTWNSYIKPRKNAEWCHHTIEAHGLTADDERISSAPSLVDVWQEFKAFIEQHTTNKKGILCAWNGKACDVEWLFRICEEILPGKCLWPENLEYFLDPAQLIRNYKSCKLNPAHKDCHLLGLGLGEVYCYVTGRQRLDGAHDALNDADAQCDIVDDDRLFSFLNKPNGIELVQAILEPKRKAREKALAEFNRAVPVGWSTTCNLSSLSKDQKKMTSAERQQKAIKSACGVGERGPSISMKRILSKQSLVDLFLFFFQPNFLQVVATETNRYGNADWVKPTASYWEENDENEAHDDIDDDHLDDMDGEEPTTTTKRRKIFVPCKKDDPGARHRCNKSRTWIKVTPGFVLVYFGIILCHGAIKMRKISQLWGAKWQTGIPFVQNACTINAFNQVRRYIHFVDNSKLYPKGDVRYSPIQKIQSVLDYFQVRLSLAYILGDRLSIDESMIKYCGKFISWVQYMPKKPIKHGIKVYALRCAYTGYLYAFEIYTGKNGSKKGTPRYVIERLLRMSGIVPVVGKLKQFTGRILYTDNWYTSLEVMQYVYEIYRMMMVGTVTLTVKKSRTADDFPFHRIKNSLQKKKSRGWMRLAYRDVKNRGGTAVQYVVQATVWLDKKLVGFLHNHLVQPSNNHKVVRYDKVQGRKKEVPAHAIISDYNQYMGGVDAKDRDTADWSVSLKSNRFYMRIFYWIFDSIIHAMWVLVKMNIEGMDDVELHGTPWQTFKSKDTGRQDFQMVLGIQLIRRGLEMDWEGDSEEDFREWSGRPEYCRSINLVPCECPNTLGHARCFFCLYNHTNGVDHQKGERKRQMRSLKEVRHHSRMPETLLDIGSSYWRVCYRNIRDAHPKMQRFKVRKRCNFTSRGCRGCNKKKGAFVCSNCWPLYLHDL